MLFYDWFTSFRRYYKATLPCTCTGKILLLLFLYIIVLFVAGHSLSCLLRVSPLSISCHSQLSLLLSFVELLKQIQMFMLSAENRKAVMSSDPCMVLVCFLPDLWSVDRGLHINLLRYMNLSAELFYFGSTFVFEKIKFLALHRLHSYDK